MIVISNNVKFVWAKGERDQVVPGLVNQEGRFLCAFCADYARIGKPMCFSFEEIERAE